MPRRGIEVASMKRKVQMARKNVTLLELVSTVAEHTRSEAELIATVAHMVNRSHVRLCGNFKGQRFNLSTSTAA